MFVYKCDNPEGRMQQTQPSLNIHSILAPHSPTQLHNAIMISTYACLCQLCVSILLLKSYSFV